MARTATRFFALALEDEMTLYRVIVGKREFEVEVTGSALRVNGEQIQARLTPLNEVGLFLLRQGERKLELHLRRQRDNTIAVLAKGRHVIAQVEKATGQVFGKAKTRAGDVIAPMPGIVVRTLVADGDQVEKGQVLVVVESMKMQMEFRAPVSGRIEKVAVQANDQVDKGSLMVRVVEDG
jgi:biotin carboxyl carrier protein